MRERFAASSIFRGGLATVVIAAALSAPASAQDLRQHVGQLIGEIPDTSNWPHPAAADANRFPRSNATPAELAYRNEKALLGKLVFWDEQLSADNTMSCATCHIPAAGGTDARKGGLHSSGNLGAFGVIHQARVAGKIDYGFVNPPIPSIDRRITGLHTPTMIGAYVFNKQFWDTRAEPQFRDTQGSILPGFDDWASLESQVVGPPISDTEMGHEDINWTSGHIQKKLATSFPLALVDPKTIPADILPWVKDGITYKVLFDKIFSNDPLYGGLVGVTRERIAMAISHYERMLIPDQAPIDLGTMTKSEVAGFDLMKSSGCFSCHSSSANPTISPITGKLDNAFDNPFSDGRRHTIGFGFVKTPTLRNVGLRKRFFSTGQGNNGANTLNDIVTFYDNQPGSLGLDGSNPDGTLTEQERQDVLAFLGHALTDPRVAKELPPFDRPELASERKPFNPFEGNEYGTGTPGPSGNTPEIIANSPPLVPKSSIGSISDKAPVSWFKIGVGKTVANRAATMLVGTAKSSGTVLVGGMVSLGPTVTTNSQGIATAHKPLPLTPATVGIDFFVQWVISEPLGTAFSNAAVFTPFKF